MTVHVYCDECVLRCLLIPCLGPKDDKRESVDGVDALIDSLHSTKLQMQQPT